MKCLKEPLSRMANREDQTGGTFFEQRFKSVGILDEQSLLAACIYIDLGPSRAAKVARALETPYTSIRTRSAHLRKHARAAKGPSAGPRKKKTGARSSAGVEDSLWLCPIEDRSQVQASREGMFKELALQDYLLLVDYSAHLDRQAENLRIERSDRNPYSPRLQCPRLARAPLCSSKPPAIRQILRSQPGPPPRRRCASRCSQAHQSGRNAQGIVRHPGGLCFCAALFAFASSSRYFSHSLYCGDFTKPAYSFTVVRSLNVVPSFSWILLSHSRVSSC